ncbi:NAD-dependent epimerase/dehydratase family protein [Aquihabitans daechungensis]|uniref:NAD-dependent epimerase/dehydratase family protein n=1 Tax=Aquihabitans daechungensis TaxID=1052257 RepID=UPI003BA09C97
MAPTTLPDRLRPQRGVTRSTVVVTGATGNIGSALVRRLVGDDRVSEVRAVARRISQEDLGRKVRWFALDVAHDDLSRAFDGADVVIHLAWRIQPSWDLETMRSVNVDGSTRVFEAAIAAGAAIVHASSLGAYGPGPKDRLVGEDWPVSGHPDHPYSAHKAEVEHVLDRLGGQHPDVRIARMRPALVMQSGAGQELRRYFLPRHLPFRMVRSTLVQRLPVRFQVVHADDVADAFARAALSEAHGAFNVATDEVIGGRQLSQLQAVVRPIAAAAWRIHAQPVDPGWVTLLFRSPLIDSRRAREELGWAPDWSGPDALEAGLAGIQDPPEPRSPALRGDAA